MNYFPRRSDDDPDIKIDVSSRVVSHILQISLATVLASGLAMYINEQLMQRDLTKLRDDMASNTQKIEDLQRMVWAHVGDGTHGQQHQQPYQQP